MKNYSDRETEKSLVYLERRINHEYNKTWKKAETEANLYFSRFKDRYEEEYKAYEEGFYTKSEFDAWVTAQIGRGKRWETVRDEIANRMVECDVLAAGYIRDSLPVIASLNFNYQAFEISQAYDGIAFNIWDENVVKALIQNESIDLPNPSVKVYKDLVFNKQKLQSTLISGIMRGVPIDKMAKEFQKVVNMDKNSAIRNARTAYTGAQNAGRLYGLEKATEMGIHVEKEWIATLDETTRDSHQEMDGKIVPYDKPFPNGLMYPGDRSGKASEIWNCRCTMRGVLPYDDSHRETYKQWLARMEMEQVK